MTPPLRSALRATALLVLLVSGSSAQRGDAWEMVGSPPISAATGICCQIRFDPQGVLHVAYQDQSVGGGRASVQRFVDGQWEYVGAQGSASLGIAWYNHLRFGAGGDLYLCCRDYAVGGRFSTRRFPAGGTAWENVGPGGASPDEAHYTWIEIGPGNAPYVMFEDRGTVPIDRPSVMRFDPSSSSWSFVGERGFSSAPTGYDSIGFDSQGHLYAAFADGNHPDPFQQGRASVMRWDETSGQWSLVGSPGFSTTGALNLVLAFDHADVPYVAYLQYHQQLAVMKFDGSAWVGVGGSASGMDRPVLETEGWRQWISLVFDSQNQPYVAYQLYDEGNKAAVRRLEGASWELVGARGFSGAASDYMALAIDRNDVPHVVFRDMSQGGRVVVMRHAPSPSTYGEALTSSLGCRPEISATGTASPSSGQPFLIGASRIISQRNGMLLWSAGPDHLPWGAGWLALRAPLHRTALQSSGGSQDTSDCSGSYLFDFNPLLAAGATGLAAGSYGFAQYWYRDPGSPGLTGLSEGVRFRVDP